jgi:hypothetical protein
MKASFAEHAQNKRTQERCDALTHLTAHSLTHLRCACPADALAGAAPALPAAIYDVTVCRCSAADGHANTAQPAQSPRPRSLPTLPSAPLPQSSTAGIAQRRARTAEPPPRRYADTTTTTAIGLGAGYVAMQLRAAGSRRATLALSHRLAREPGSLCREPLLSQRPRAAASAKRRCR